MTIFHHMTFFQTYYTRISVGKCHITNVICHSHKSGHHKVTSHDDHGKVVHRPCSSCISSIQN